MPIIPKNTIKFIEEAALTNRKISCRWKLVQEKIGTQIDGVPGRDTTAALLSFQQRHDLAATAVMNDETMRKIEMAPLPDQACLAGLELGMWLDYSHVFKTRDQQARRLDLLMDMGVRHLSLADIGADGKNLKWSAKKFRSYGELARERNMTVCLMGYLYPDKGMLDTQMSHWDELCSACRPDALEADQEHQHRSRHVKGFGSLQDASEAIVKGMLALKKKHKIKELKVTTHPYHPEFRVPTIINIKGINRVVNQAYCEAYDKDGRITPWGGIDGPGRKQRWACDQVWRFDPEIRDMGLSNYDKRWIGHTVEMAMRTELGVCSVRGVERVYYWSEKHVDGGGEPARFLTSIFGGRS